MPRQNTMEDFISPNAFDALNSINDQVYDKPKSKQNKWRMTQRKPHVSPETKGHVPNSSSPDVGSTGSTAACGTSGAVLEASLRKTLSPPR